MPQARSHATAIAFHNNIYVIGGRLNDKPTKIVSIYNPSENSWNEVENNLVAERELPENTIFNERILVFGGKDELQSPLNSIEVYNGFNENKSLLPLWGEKLPELPLPGGVFRGGSFEDKIILIKEATGTDKLRNNIYILE